MCEEIKLEPATLVEFIRIVEEWRDTWDVGDRGVYRGHGDYNWILVARLFRDPGASAENRRGDDPSSVEKQLEGEHLRMEEAHRIERRLLDGFSRYLYAYRPDLVCTAPEGEKSDARAMQEWRQLAIAQHYGLPTRFLDFTTNPLVGLYFAVEGRAAARRTKSLGWQEQDSAVWCVEAPNRRKVWEVWRKEGVWLSPLEFAEERSDPPIADFVDSAFVPEHIDERVRAQGSVFMCEPRGKKESWQLHAKLKGKERTVLYLGSGQEHEKETRTLRIRVPREGRQLLREQLDLVGINRATLFPDLGSAAEYLAWAVHQRRRL